MPKILAFSDLHCDLAGAEQLVARSEEVDVVLGVGDFASVHRQLEETVEALGAIKKPSVVVCGNNETATALREACAKSWPTAKVLHGEGVEIEGVRFWGIGGGIPTTPWDWSYDLTEDEARLMLEDCPDGAVLLTHSPPFGHVDGSRGDHYGSKAIAELIEEKKPKLVVCGHIHECWTQESKVGETRIMNLGPKGTIIEVSG
jgi:Icc-related predicted phosphoesterase